MTVNNDDALNSVAAQQPVSEQQAEQGPGPIARLKHFLREVHVELKKTNWPSRDELTKFTVVVLVTILAVTLYLYASDTVAFWLMKGLGIAG